MIRSFTPRFVSIVLFIFSGIFLADSSTSLADSLVVNPSAVNSGAEAIVTGPGIQPGASVLVWGGSSLVNTVNLPGNALDVAISGSYAFVAAESAGIHIVDITDPTNASLVATVQTVGSAQSIFIDGDYAYIGSIAGGLEVIDVADPSSPVLITNKDLPRIEWVDYLMLDERQRPIRSDSGHQESLASNSC